MQRPTTPAPVVRTQVRSGGLATNHTQAVSTVRGLTRKHSQAVTRPA